MPPSLPQTFCFTNRTYVSFVIPEDGIDEEVAKKDWPLTLNVLKNLQFCRLVIETAGVLPINCVLFIPKGFTEYYATGI